MRRFYFSAILLLLYSAVFSQGSVYNNGADIYVKTGAYVIIKSDSLINNLYGDSGFIANNGVLVVEGNIHNNALIAAANDSIFLTGDWINNNTYTSNNSWVDMNGADQLITGSQVTTFNNLRVEGAGSYKRQTLNAITNNLLQLADAELATDSFEMLVTNTNTGTITWNTGFVSSVGPGMLARVTAADSGYIFPVGSPSYIAAPPIFRPVQMAPATSAGNTYGAALVKDNATVDGYNVNSVDSILCTVNHNFYHRLYHVSGSDSIALTMYFDPAADGNWTDEAHWDNNIWNDLGTPTAGTGLGFSTVTVNGINNFIPNPFALGQRKITVSAVATDTIFAGKSVVLNPTIIGPPDVNVVWTPDSFLSCNNCPNPTANPVFNTVYSFTAIDSEGCSATDSISVIVIIEKFKMPNAFTPNGDGTNDLFGPVTLYPITVKAFRIYNRWGELVHNSTAYWDGKFKGSEQPAGTYVYYIEALTPNPTDPDIMVTHMQEGAVTLLR